MTTVAQVADLCRDSLALANQVERCGGPRSDRRNEFLKARNTIEGTLAEIESSGGLGIAPLFVLGWVLTAAGVITAAAVVPALVRGSQQIVETVGSSTSGLVKTTERAITIGTYAALGLGAYWAAKLVMKKTA
jgi:hypothetical protein